MIINIYELCVAGSIQAAASNNHTTSGCIWTQIHRHISRPKRVIQAASESTETPHMSSQSKEPANGRENMMNAKLIAGQDPGSRPFFCRDARIPQVFCCETNCFRNGSGCISYMILLDLLAPFEGHQLMHVTGWNFVAPDVFGFQAGDIWRCRISLWWMVRQKA